MFDNISNKMKTSAKVLTAIGILFSVIYGVALMILDVSMIFFGVLTIIIGSLLSWVSSFTLYGFGVLIEQLEQTSNYSEKSYELLNTIEKSITYKVLQTTEETKEPQETQKSEHQWICSACGKLRNTSPCPYCGNK